MFKCFFDKLFIVHNQQDIDASYEEKHCSRSWTKTIAQLKISDDEKHNSRRANEEKHNSRRPDEEKHDSDERNSTIYCILIKVHLTNSKNKNCCKLH